MTIVTDVTGRPVEDIDFGMDDLGDLRALIREMRASGPTSWVRFVGQPALHLTSHELVSAAFREDDVIPQHLFYEDIHTDFIGRTVQSLYGESHRMARSLQQPFFRQRLMPDYVAPVFQPVADDLIDQFVDRGEVDLVPAFTKLYPMRVIMRVLDLPEKPGVDWARLAWEMIRAAYDPDQARRAIAEFDEHVGPIIEERRSRPGSDLISALVTAEFEGERMTDSDVYSFVRLMFPAGSDTTYLGMGNVLTALLTHPEALDAVRADPDAHARWANEEGLRWEPSVAHLVRRTGDEHTEWRGLSLPPRTLLLLSVMGANHDPAVYPDPDRFDIHRHPQNVMTWGFAAHLCLGIHFAKAEMDVALRRLLARLPDLRLRDPENPPSAHGPLLRGPESLDVVWG